MRGSLVVGAGLFIGNVTGFFRVLIVAWYLGTHARADSLVVAVGPVDNLANAIINTALVSFVPMLVRSSPELRAALFARLTRVFTWVLAGVAASIALLAPWIATLLGPGLAPQQHNEAVDLLRLLAPVTFFAGVSAVYSALLYTERRFTAPALYQAFINGGTVVGSLALWRVLGIYGFAIGYSAGAAIHLAFTWFLSRDLRRIRPTEGPPAPVREILATPGLYLLYASLISSNVLVTRAFATHAGPGMAAAFDYCLRCVSVVVAYLVYPVANSLLPEIARLRASQEGARARRLIDVSSAAMAAAAVAACALGLLVRTPAIGLLFQRGSFTAESTRLVSLVFLGFAPSIVGWALLDLLSRCSFALDRPKPPLFAAVLPVVVNLAIMSAIGKNATPVQLGLGASVGLAVGCASLFAAVRFGRRGVYEAGNRPNMPAEPVELSSL